MQLLKNKKFIIACIVVAAVILITIIAVVLRKKFVELPKKYTGGEMTLVDTIAKGSGHEVDVYITKDQNILLEMENAEYGGFYFESMEMPAYDFSQTDGEKTGGMRCTIDIYTNRSDEGITLPSGVSFPCECSLKMNSELLGIEYSIDLTVNQEIEYKKGSMTTKEPLVASALEGYEEYVNQYGELQLPDKAIALGFTKRVSDYVAGDGNYIVLDVCWYLDNNIRKEFWVTSASNKAAVEAFFTKIGDRKLVVNDVEVRFITDGGLYIACYTIGNVTYVNPSVYQSDDPDSAVSDDVLKKAMKPYIVK